MLTILLPLGLTLETAVFVLAGFFCLQRHGYTFAEAAAGAILLLFVGVSLLHQIDILAGSPWPGGLLELMALVGALILGRRRWPAFIGWCRSAGGVARQEMFPGLCIAAAWVAIAVGMIWDWKTGIDRVPIFAGWEPGRLSLLAKLHPIPPLNAPALFYHTARFGLSPGACGFGLLAYMVVGFSTYALARRYAWPPMAMTITLMVMSMPRLALLALHPSAELISVAAVSVGVMLLYRLLEQHQAWDLRFFLLCQLFSIHAHPMSMALALVMGLLLMVVMIRRHGWLLWRELVVARPLPTVLILLPGLLLAQAPAFALNLAHDHPLFGVPIVFDTDGIIGAAANLVRYLFISIDPTAAVCNALAWLVGVDPKRLLMGLYNLLVVSMFGRSGASAPFVPVFSGNGLAGFGPFAALLVLPSMVYAGLRGPRRLKACCVAWAGYLYLSALVLAWTTDNIIVLTPLFAANGLMVAFSLPPWRLRRRGMRILQVLCALLLAGVLVHGGRPMP